MSNNTPRTIVQLPYQSYMPSNLARRWFTSDLHFGHQLCTNLRGFHTVEKMNEMLAENWKRLVQPEDEIFIIGDAAMGKRVETIPIFGTLPGKKYLVPGNHDKCGPWNYKDWELYSKYFTILPPIYELALAREKSVILCHFPYDNLDSSTEGPRYLEFRPENKGAWLLHGHTHSPLKKQGSRMIHVGTDAWNFHPVSELDILNLICGSG